MFDFWNSELSEEETNALIDKAAREIRRRNMSVPALLALEMHKPLAFVGGNAAIVFAPFMVPVLGYDAVNDYSRLLSKRENVERLLEKLEMPEDPVSEGTKED